MKSLLRHYTGRLTKLLTQQRIPHEWVSSVSITLDFRPQVEDEALIEGAAFVEPFACRCQITDGRGRHCGIPEADYAM